MSAGRMGRWRIAGIALVGCLARVCVGVGVVLVAAALLVAPAWASFPRLWSNGLKTTALRDGKTAPKGQPDGVVFGSPVGSALFVYPGTETFEVCSEPVLTTSVLVNNGVAETKLAATFGLFESDSCSNPFFGGSEPMPYFSTLPSGVLGAEKKPARITFTNPNIVTLHNITVNVFLEGKACAWHLNGLSGTTEQSGLVEEEARGNLVLRLAGTVPVVGAGCPAAGEASFSLPVEMVSDATEEVFVQ